MAKPITELTKDIRKLIETGRETAGPVIVRSLQSEGPWWTSSFGTKWRISGSPVKPVDDRAGITRDFAGIPKRTNVPKPSVTAMGVGGGQSSMKFALAQPMYVGNSASYAGFAVNRPNATVPRRDGRNVTYAQHKKDGFKLTAKNQNPDWYNVYTKSGGLLGDLDKAFKATRLG